MVQTGGTVVPAAAVPGFGPGGGGTWPPVPSPPAPHPAPAGSPPGHRGCLVAWRRLLGLDRSEAIAPACRGSGDPAALAWLAEGLGLEEGSRVLDIGGGLGGPSAWLVDRNRVRATSTDPALDGLVGANRVFGLPAVATDGAALPFRDDAAAAFDEGRIAPAAFIARRRS